MIGQKITLASLYFGCFLVVFNMYQINALFGFVSVYLVILLLSHQQVNREVALGLLEDEIIQQSLWGKR